MHIIGAGLAGLLAGAMLRHKAIAIHEGQDALPNNHSAVLRFRSPVVGEVLNIPFRKVWALKATQRWSNPVADALAYSAKTNGSHTLRSILSADGQVSERYIAPGNLIAQIADGLQCPINYGTVLSSIDLINKDDEAPIISTIPMPALMAILGWEQSSEFRFRRGINIVATIPGADAYCSLYVPDPLLPFSRVSLTGDNLIVECTQDFATELDALPAMEQPQRIRSALAEAMNLMGLDGVEAEYEAHHQKYAKILPIDEEERRAFIMWASTQFNVYSLGRFATWRPGLLLDDVVQDVRVIQRLIAKSGEAYLHNLKD